MNIDVMFTPAALGTTGAAGRSVVVIDVLRATSTIIEALINGARDILPFETVEDAVKATQGLGHDAAVLCGERDIEAVSGFDLGNSPLEFNTDRIAGKTLVMTTTNGTAALLAASAADSCHVGSFLNMSAAADAVADAHDVLLLCAGREGAFAAEDAVCAGLMARRLVGHRRAAGERVRFNDATHASMLMASRWSTRLAGFLARTAAGRRLRNAGYANDVRFCAQLDRNSEVPHVVSHRVQL